ncbi:transglycosylase SLT domain-containing protein [Elioraea thermophila]|uniref:transglycosylase SLT domain-containing protein n=1 Tax=Elioraea thermophila TaxID=2185104 RepID=UPI000DF47AE1|nr:transglycosylase SLT domain-containing protein [Elioraea thermophila]
MSRVLRSAAVAVMFVSVGFAAAANTIGERNERSARGELAARCLDAARMAEAVYGLPEGLLVAVAIVESALHPYALGTERASRFPGDAGEAQREAETLARGARSLSAGCFQVNLKAHGREARAWVFDAHASALFAAALLADARRRAGSFAAALALYNGAAPGSATGLAYACRVRAALAEVAPASLSALPLRCAPGPMRVVTAKARTLLEIAGWSRTDLAEAPAR